MSASTGGGQTATATYTRARDEPAVVTVREDVLTSAAAVAGLVAGAGGLGAAMLAKRVVATGVAYPTADEAGRKAILDRASGLLEQGGNLLASSGALDRFFK